MKEILGMLDLLQPTVSDCHTAFKSERGGHPAQYIPALRNVDPDLFGISICTTNGEIFSSGDVEQMFTIQSVSKPFLYGRGLSMLGERAVLEKVGVEPTGFNFSSIVRLESGSNRAENPMINAGAIATAGLLASTNRKELLAVSKLFEGFLDREKIEIDNEVFSSEVATGNRNYSIANLLKFHKVLDCSVEDALDIYFRACSTKINTRDLSLMAATLANWGKNPITGQSALLHEHASKVLAVMSTCGFYDYSGEFTFFTGIPAKSGVSGAVMAVVPGVMGIGIYSPRIDEKGNCVRALGALPYLSKKLNLHVFHSGIVKGRPKSKKKTKPVNLPTKSNLEEVVQRVSALPLEQPTTYLAELDESSSDFFAISICSVDGREISIGQSDVSFSIQAGINPIVFGHALETRGLGRILDKVGVEPSGNPYNAIRFQPGTNIPYNPLSNAGAITIDSQLSGSNPEDRFIPLLNRVQKLCNDESIDVCSVVENLEREHSNRNKAIAYMLRQFNVIHDIDRPLEIYFKQCSIRVNCQQVARMAAVLANGGIAPWSREQLFSPFHNQNVLSVMYTCGLYDYSGRFAYDVGIPAKSGISGIIYGALPGKFGIAIYAPGVDNHGNSIRGLQFLKYLSKLSKISIYDRFKENS